MVIKSWSQRNPLKGNDLRQVLAVRTTLLKSLSVVFSADRSSRMPGNQPTQTVISFGPFEADLQTQELRKNGVRLRLPGQSFQFL